MAKALPVPEEGDSFTLVKPGGVGSDLGKMVEGIGVRVREVVDHGTPGVGEHDGDPVVVVEWEEDAPAIDDDGEPTTASVTRARSFGLTEFHDHFEEA